MKICLIGSIPKGDDERKNWKDWKNEYKEKLKKIHGAEFLDGDAWRDETKSLELVGHDAKIIKQSDLVIVNAETKLGAGTAQEILIAKYFSKPVVTIIPKNTHHRRTGVVFDKVLIDDWIHPFLLVLSDLVAERIEDSILWIEEYNNDASSKKIKSMNIIDKAIEAYMDTTK